MKYCPLCWQPIGNMMRFCVSCYTTLGLSKSPHQWPEVVQELVQLGERIQREDRHWNERCVPLDAILENPKNEDHDRLILRMYEDTAPLHPHPSRPRKRYKSGIFTLTHQLNGRVYVGQRSKLERAQSVIMAELKAHTFGPPDLRREDAELMTLGVLYCHPVLTKPYAVSLRQSLREQGVPLYNLY